jgi:hypothetical protein
MEDLLLLLFGQTPELSRLAGKKSVGLYAGESTVPALTILLPVSPLPRPSP